MNCEIIKRYIEKVKDGDIVYFLGDFAMASRKIIKMDHFYLFREIFDQLPGRKFLIRGNHDKLRINQYLEMGFEEVRYAWNFRRQNIVLTHDPGMITKPHAPKGKFKWIAGHVHQNWLFRKKINCLNVSVDVHDFYPLNITEALKFFK